MYWRPNPSYEFVPNVKDTRPLERALAKAFKDDIKGNSIYLRNSSHRHLVEGIRAAGIEGADELLKEYWKHESIEILLSDEVINET